MDIDDALFITQLKTKFSNFVDPQYEQQRNLMKEVNVMGYILEVLELMRKKHSTFELEFVEYVKAKFHNQNNIITPKMKSFVTILFYSYLKIAHKSNDLTYVKRYVHTRRTSNSIAFYLKLRKTILSNFSYDSRSQMLDGLQIKFDDWSTLTTRFLGAHHISTIGSKVKEENAKTKVYDKILTNSIDAVTFVSLCVEINESINPEKHQNFNTQSPQQDQSQQQFEKSESQNGDNHENEQQQTQNEQQINEFKVPQQQQQQQQQQQHQSHAMNSLSTPQKKLFTQLQETKYQLLDEKMRQSIVISKTIKTYENLSDEYMHLMKHSKEQMQFIIYLVNKFKNKGPLNEQDFQRISDFSQFHYISGDPKEALMKIGAYDYAK